METSTNALERVKIDLSWKIPLAAEFGASYMNDLREFLAKEIKAKKTIYPRGQEIFEAFNLTHFDDVKVVIIGQDPYHGPQQAHGLSFSVRKGIPIPPSLQNIYKEMHDDLGIAIPKHGDLTHWAKQGVLLLNAVLTVQSGQAASHRGRGWEKFTDKVIQVLSDRDDPVVFVLWGSFAHSKAAMIRVPPHKILKAPHPSPLSAHRGFFGSKPFSKINKQLTAWGKEPVDWAIPE